MATTLGHTQYGKDEIRVVRLLRDGDPHHVVDHNVSISLVGDFDAAHLEGDNSTIVPTDTIKNTTFAYALRDDVVTQPESFGLALARHFVDDLPQVTRCRVTIETFPWTRLDGSDGEPAPHSFARSGDHVRTATVTSDADGDLVVSGIRDVTVLKTTDSGFEGFHVDEYTTLQPADDRILATSVTSQWKHGSTDRDWAASFATVQEALMGAFADHVSSALQQTVYAMGAAAVAADPGLDEIRFTCPNAHHFRYDTEKLGLDNPLLVFHADDRPYGQIEVTVRREGAPDPGPAYDPGQAW